jgi:type IX secretion system PorP/SprF family membrane protein
MNFKFLFYISILFFSIKASAQDPIFTQYFLVPQTVNPGFTGFLNTWHAGILHRTHWWPEGPQRKMETQYGFVDTAVSDAIGLGVTILNHREEFTGYNYIQVNGAFSYWIPLGNDWSARPGIEVGYGSKDFGFGNLLLEDQVDVNSGAISGNTTDPGALNARSDINFVDVSAGVVIDKENTWFGLSLKHLTRPDIAFTDNGNTQLDIFFSLHAGHVYELNNSPSSVLPADGKLFFTANYMRQSEYNRLDIGSALMFKDFSVGATLVTNTEHKSSNGHYLSSINPFLYAQLMEHFIVGLSYDFNTSKIKSSPAIFELSLTWQLEMNQDCSHCPNYQVQLKRGGRAGYQRR